MDKIGHIEVCIKGNIGELELSPAKYDIDEIKQILDHVENLLFPGPHRDRPLISYEIKSGSVRHLFTTSIQAIIGFSAIMTQVSVDNSIDFLELPTAKAVEYFQRMSYEKNYVFEISSSTASKVLLSVTPETQFIRSEYAWVDTELYLYGQLTNAGGKGKANIHLDTKEYGVLTIATPKKMLSDMEENMLYKDYGVRVKGQQNLSTGEIDKSSLKIVELIDYEAKFSDSYLKSLIKKAAPKLKGIKVDDWLDSLRGGYEA